MICDKGYSDQLDDQIVLPLYSVILYVTTAIKYIRTAFSDYFDEVHKYPLIANFMKQNNIL